MGFRSCVLHASLIEKKHWFGVGRMAHYNADMLGFLGIQGISDFMTYCILWLFPRLLLSWGMVFRSPHLTFGTQNAPPARGMSTKVQCCTCFTFSCCQTPGKISLLLNFGGKIHRIDPEDSVPTPNACNSFAVLWRTQDIEAQFPSAGASSRNLATFEHCTGCVNPIS